MQNSENPVRDGEVSMKDIAEAAVASQSLPDKRLEVVIPDRPRKAGTNSSPRQKQDQQAGKPVRNRGQGSVSSQSKTVSSRGPRPRRTAKPLRRLETEEDEELDLSVIVKRESVRPPEALPGPHIQGVDLGALFERPNLFHASRTNATKGISPPSSTGAADEPTPNSPSSQAGLAQVLERSVLERAAGEYSRYHAQDVGRIRRDTLSTVGPVAFAELALSHRPDVGLGMRKNAIAVIGRLVKDDAARGESQV